MAAKIHNCDIGLGVLIEPIDDWRRARISVNPEPIRDDFDGPALRRFMEETAVAWLRKVAPHRLRDSDND